MPLNVGPLEIGIVLVIALIAFGPKRLPDLGHGLGHGLRQFKDGLTGRESEAELEEPSEGRSPRGD